MTITPRMFKAQRERRFGRSNPERMDLEFWLWMVRGAEEARTRDEEDGEEEGEDADALIRTPYQARKHFGMEHDDSVAVWNFDRMGATRTPHPDGRMICIGGEHEDYYDPDFCIYNDVVVLDLDGSIAIQGYPRDVFPPTDFHTATLIGDRVIVIGRLGYPDERRYGRTPVMALNLAHYRMEERPSLGEAPGWIFKHEAELSHGIITIRGGEIEEPRDGESVIRRNFDDFAYDVDAGTWKRLTDRRWRQFAILDEGGKSFMRGPRISLCGALSDETGACNIGGLEGLDDVFVYVNPEALRPRSIPFEPLPSEEFAYPLVRRIVVAGMTVSIEMAAFSIEVIIEGDMDGARAESLARDVMQSIEADTKRPCLLDRLS